MTAPQLLQDYLTRRKDQKRIRLSFAEVADILGEPLPEAAFCEPPWWANRPNEANGGWATAWLDAGFRVRGFCQGGDAGWVEFARQTESLPVR